MKKTFKFLVIFIISILIFEYIFSSTCISYASDGEFAVGNKVANLITNLGGGIVSILIWLPKLRTTAILIGVDISVSLFSKLGDPGGSGGTSGFFITPYDIFFNKFQILNINIFDFDGMSSDSIAYQIRSQIASWYYVMRILAGAVLLVILIYVGIRMAIASVADEKAKYKKMLADWCVSVALVFVMHYITIFIIYVNDAIVNSLSASLGESKAEGIIAGLAIEALLGVGIRSLVAFLVFVGILAQTIFFFVAYFNRFLKVGFLILISPLITLTYSIDRMGDGKAQAFGNWLKEFIFTVLIQPFHCIVYMSFIHIAFELVGFEINLKYLNDLFNVNQLAQGFLAILCIKFVNDGEKIVRKIFGFADDNGKTSFAAGAITTVALVKNASKMGQKGSDLINKGKASLGKFGEHFESEKGQLKEMFGGMSNKISDKIPDKVKNAANAGKDKVKGATQKLSNASKNRKEKRNLRGKPKKTDRNKFTSKLGGKIRDFANKKARHLSVAAIAGMAAYATGSTDAFTAFGIAKATKDSADAFFSKTSKHLLGRDAGFNNQQDEKEYAKLKENRDKLQKSLEDAGETLKNFDEIANTYQEAESEKAEAKRLEDEADQLQEDLKNGKNKLSPRKQSEKIQKNRKEAKRLRRDAAKKRKSMEDKDKDGKIRDALKKPGMTPEKLKEKLEKDLEKDTKDLNEMKEKLNKFWDKGSIVERLQNRSQKNTAKDLENKAAEIQEEIVSILRKRRNIDLAEGEDGEMPQELITAEDKLGKAMAKSLVDKAKYDFLSQEYVNTDKILGDMGFGGDEQLKSLVEEYGTILSGNKYSENVGKSETFGFTENGYYNKIADQISSLHSKSHEQ